MCLACNPPNIWNSSSKLCTPCPDNTVYDTLTKSCQPCPNYAPIKVNGACQQCPPGSFYNTQYKICMQCAPGSTYDSANNTCKLPTPTQPVCEVGAKYNVMTGKCECPSDRPYSNKVECLACTAPSYWNQTTLTCQACPNGQVFVPQLGRCSPCPPQFPVLANGECRACPPGSNYSTYSQVCVQCATGSQFDTNTGQCRNITIITQPKCSTGATFNQVLQKCVCPSQTPYDNGAVCVACDAPYYWNTTSSMCSICADGSVYNANRKLC